ncbi:MAG: hypothetical protein ACR2NZ_05300, partial [Rubripirellula sp.]
SSATTHGISMNSFANVLTIVFAAMSIHGVSLATGQNNPESVQGQTSKSIAEDGATQTQSASSISDTPIPADEASVFLIGNSLTWDTVPPWLDEDVQWHVDCGKSLPYIYANPEEPCVTTSTLWPTALIEKQYDILCFQPHYGSTVEKDAEVIGKWLAMQPKARVVIHTGWARTESRAEEYASNDSAGDLQHSEAYFQALLETLRRQHPNRDFRVTAAMRLLNAIAAEIASGDAPLESIEALHRDAIHMKLPSGKYLMHNLMRQALDQPRTERGFDLSEVSVELKAYLAEKLSAVELSQD